ncbi:MAG: hypothetical protein O3C18_04185 [Bacteroidetes bacterium]|nr:hypothetical protein [Bacteroidota bacterium]MDA1242342.1 hypothetical protein [Bacteroidota bacterium]
MAPAVPGPRGVEPDRAPVAAPRVDAARGGGRGGGAGFGRSAQGPAPQDVDVWVRPGQFDWALGLMKSWPAMTVKAIDLHSTTFTFDGVHSLDLHRMPHHLGGRVDMDRRFDAAFAQPGDRTQAMALLLANAFVNDAPDQFVGLYTLVDWHRSGVAWSAVEPMIAAEGLRPVVAAHLAQFPSSVNDVID